MSFYLVQCFCLLKSTDFLRADSGTFIHVMSVMKLLTNMRYPRGSAPLVGHKIKVVHSHILVASILCSLCPHWEETRRVEHLINSVLVVSLLKVRKENISAFSHFHTSWLCSGSVFPKCSALFCLDASNLHGKLHFKNEGPCRF